ncbi:hypothetical protein [Brevibacillus dissolubilis]|uniref:hypothetical protein n=1 Tax=Brevibacillus dissolubilis TaxID=1844116 RepID=UPI001116F1C5|nr:hypothetical protein [Brevibacillus dissolubilis]
MSDAHPHESLRGTDDVGEHVCGTEARGSEPTNSTSIDGEHGSDGLPGQPATLASQLGPTLPDSIGGESMDLTIKHLLQRIFKS